jgi:hypothetical protein
VTGARLKGAHLKGVVAERVVGWHQQQRELFGTGVDVCAWL